MEGADYLVDLTFEISTTGYDRDRIGRVAARFAPYLPEGSEPLGGRWPRAGTPGVATVSVRVPAVATMARALHDVATALDRTAAEEPNDLSLGELSTAVIGVADRRRLR
jgi:hypothetical protein